MKGNAMNKQKHFNKQAIQHQRGAVAIIVALCLTLLIGMLGLVLDLGHLYVAKTELQNAADAAALSGAKELNGTVAGIDGAVAMANYTAGLNNFFGNNGSHQATLSNIRFRSSSNLDPESEWLSASVAKTLPADKLFIRVDTASGNLNTWFAPIWNIMSTSTFGSAVAGRFPPGALTPMFVPIVRRNADQRNGVDVSYPNCSGYIYNPKTFNKDCPNPVAATNPAKDPADYRTFDFSGNWGFLKANQCKQYTNTATTELSSCTGALPTGVEKGSYYIITPRSNNKWDTGDSAIWDVGAAWTGNFGFMMKSNDDPTQKSLMAAICKGGGITEYSVPGCGEVHTGGLSGPKLEDNLNTRFDLQGNQTLLPHSSCPSDTNIYTSNWISAGYYSAYSAGSLSSPPTAFPPGKANRRIIRVYVIDNAWLPGFDIPTSPDDNACANQKLTGGSVDAHIVGCADFFMWKPADNQGRLYAEYVSAVPFNQCNNTTASYTEIRLYH